MTSSDSQINKPQLGRPKRAELPDVNMNTGAQSSNTERASLAALIHWNTRLLILDVPFLWCKAEILGPDIDTQDVPIEEDDAQLELQMALQR